jgi:hypothetical protein
MYDVNIIDGKTNFILKSANRKFANSWAHSAIANPQIRKFLRYASPQIENPQIFMNNPQIVISTKYHTTLSQNSPKSRLFTRFFL